jgi:mersacidin/lichenicidin family type 2 lantibiotic
MSMEEIICAWKADEEALEPHLPASPVGHELSEQELLEISGGACSWIYTCVLTCVFTQAQQ